MFLLLLMGLGAASVKAQVRIGGNGVPNAAAVLDLNTDDTNSGAKGLALPRVSLTNVSTPLTGSPVVNGMLVYNTGGTLTAGIYFWSGSLWNRVDDAIGNEFTDTIAGGGLTKTGSGTVADPYKVGVKPGGISKTMLGPSVGRTLTKVDNFGATVPAASSLRFTPTGGNFNNCIASVASNGHVQLIWDGAGTDVDVYNYNAGAVTIGLNVFCFN